MIIMWTMIMHRYIIICNIIIKFHQFIIILNHLELPVNKSIIPGIASTNTTKKLLGFSLSNFTYNNAIFLKLFRLVEIIWIHFIKFFSFEINDFIGLWLVIITKYWAVEPTTSFLIVGAAVRTMFLKEEHLVLS